MRSRILLIPTILVAILFIKINYTYRDIFNNIENKYNDSTAVNLNSEVTSSQISAVLLKNGYIKDKGDAIFISDFITNNFDKGHTLSALYDLNKRVWQLPAKLIDSIPNTNYSKQLKESRTQLGINDEYLSLNHKELSYSTTINPQKSGQIKVVVKEEIEDDGFFATLFNKKSTRLCEDVVVRLSKQYIDTLNNYEPQRETIQYLKTNSDGYVIFRGLDPEFSYSVLPIKEGYEYGASKGTIGGNLSYAIEQNRTIAGESNEDNTLTCSFIQSEQKIRIFDIQTLRQIKEDRTITIRKPSEFLTTITTYTLLFLAAWWGLFLLGRVRKRPMDNVILSILMTLTGICLLTMFSLNDPLTDKLLGVDMAQGIISGVVIIALLHSVNFKNFYRNRLKLEFDIPLECLKWIFKPFKNKVSYLTNTLTNRSKNVLSKLIALLFIIVCLPMLFLDLIKITSLNNYISLKLDKLPKGSGYLLMALLLTLLLFTPLGVAVGGMKVNLNIGILFQPSEITKYLIVIFMAAYFSVYANKIVQFSEKGNAALFGAKIKMLAYILIGLSLLVGIYLVLGDMGPALVLSFTFITLYSIIKSKIELTNETSRNKLKKILSCDVAMLIYGILSFLLFLFIGNIFNALGIFCIAWFVIWITVGIVKKQLFETPIIFNLIIAAFIFGATILNKVPGLSSIADRLESRTEMSTNTWGTLPIAGEVADAGENTQVAEGLWALASGGFWGQGVAEGSPSFIPAFHTDMILESIGEQMGFVGLLIIILLMALLIRRTIVLGYRTSHPFTFYLCMGIAIITAIQFIIISLGSTGVIPLTGVTVPFLSYGKVSMILNLVAFGIILSIASHTNAEDKSINNEVEKLTKQNIGKYNYSVSLLSWVYCILAFVICQVFFYYQVIDRNDTLVKPVYVNNSRGIPTVEYNPRIDLITAQMQTGDIYDRKGILLATSNRTKLNEYKNIYSKLNLKCDTSNYQKRYYPFAEHLFFMLGDCNTELFLSSDADSRFPKGYMAEHKHMSDLRGFDNRKRDKSGTPIKISLYSDEYSPDKFHSNNYSTEYKGLQIRDYSELVPYLKAGVKGKEIKKYNNRQENSAKITPTDLQLTIDAELQTTLQREIDKYVNDNCKNLNKLRVSVVILDAKNGDLLTSAVYPLPNYETLKERADEVYNDKNTDKSWRVYTDMDLGLVYATEPGSTAKVITGLAGYRNDVKNIGKSRYFVNWGERVYDGEPDGWVDMVSAYKNSSNCYFINLLNDKNLFSDLAYIYGSLGITINSHRSYLYNYTRPSYEWQQEVTSVENKCIEAYKKYKDAKKIQMMNNRTPGIPKEWSWSWGQNGMDATPLAMARAISVVANDGVMPISRYVLSDPIDTVKLVSSTNELKYYLKETRNYHEKKRNFSSREEMGGKTGTPEREVDKKGDKNNDAWYICFIENATIKSRILDEKSLNKATFKDVSTSAPLAIAIRMERIGKDRMSGLATTLMDEVVIEALIDAGYIKK